MNHRTSGVTMNRSVSDANYLQARITATAETSASTEVPWVTSPRSSHQGSPAAGVRGMSTDGL
jgi:hypothetical protein